MPNKSFSTTKTILNDMLPTTRTNNHINPIWQTYRTLCVCVCVGGGQTYKLNTYDILPPYAILKAQ